MKKIITPLGALITLIFVPMTWLNITDGYGGKSMAVSFYETYRAAPALGFGRLGLILIALVLLIVPFFLKNPLRKTFVVSFCVVAFVLLAAFLNLKSGMSRAGYVELGMGWFGAAFGFAIAFAGAFVRTRQNEPEKSSLPALAWIVVLICLPVSLLAYLFLFPPYKSFPMSADGMPRTSPVQYRKDENYPGVYLATYGASVLHTLEKKNSAEEAKQEVAKIREGIKKDAERARERWKNENPSEPEFSAEAEKYYRKDRTAVYLADEDKPENDYLVYVGNERANVIWASGNRFYTISSYSSDSSDIGDSGKFAAAAAFDLARSMPDPPVGTTAPTNNNAEPFSLYGFYRNELPMWLSEWSLVATPLIIAAPFLLLLISGFLKRKTA